MASPPAPVPAPALTITLFVDKASNRVAFAESDERFVDILLSFLTLPIGTVVRLLDKSSQLHGMDNLYRSVDEEHLRRSCFVSEVARTALLQPINSAEYLLQFLAILLEEDTNLGVCQDSSCRFYTRLKGGKCQCGSPVTEEIYLEDERLLQVRGIFVSSSSRFIVSDCLDVSVSSTSQVVALLGNAQLEEMEVNVGQQELVKLLQRSLISDTVLTDVFLTADIDAALSHLSVLKLSSEDAVEVEKAKSEDTSMEVKLLVDKNRNRVLYAESKDGSFAEMLLTFLSFPLGAVVRLLGGNSNLKSLENLYSRAKCLSSSNYAVSGIIGADLLLDPKIPQYYGCASQPLSVPHEAPLFRKLHFTRRMKNKPFGSYHGSSQYPYELHEKDPKVSGRFLKDSLLVVADDLSVEAFSASFCHQKLKQSAGDSNANLNVVEKMVVVGEAEAVAILKSCLFSKTTLSDVFLK